MRKKTDVTEMIPEPVYVPSDPDEDRELSPEIEPEDAEVPEPEWDEDVVPVDEDEEIE